MASIPLSKLDDNQDPRQRSAAGRELRIPLPPMHSMSAWAPVVGTSSLGAALIRGGVEHGYVWPLVVLVVASMVHDLGRRALDRQQFWVPGATLPTGGAVCSLAHSHSRYAPLGANRREWCAPLGAPTASGARGGATSGLLSLGAGQTAGGGAPARAPGAMRRRPPGQCAAAGQREQDQDADHQASPAPGPGGRGLTP